MILEGKMNKSYRQTEQKERGEKKKEGVTDHMSSAKILVPGEPNVSYICSRYYRAPELIFGATNYTLSIDTWSTGCVMAELILGQPFFPGESGIDQLVEIIKILGTPSKQEIAAMNASYVEHRFPQIKRQALSKVNY